MSFGHFLAGSLELIAIAAALGFAAVRLRGRLLPLWSGAPARLAEVILGLSLLVVILELVGVIGLYRPGWVLAACLLAGIGTGVYLGTVERRATPLPSPAIAPYAMAIAAVAAFAVALHWAMPTQTGLDIGMYLPNTTWHNAPFAERFVQDHQVGALHFTEVLRLSVWFYPQNSELLHSIGNLFLDSDFLSPLINIGWMGLCLLAAWSFGRPYGGAAVAVLALALVLDAEMLLLYQPGDAKNDVGGLFFLLASAALLVNADAQIRAGAASARPFLSGRPGLRPELPDAAIMVAGLAAGLALGTKLNLLAPFGLLSLGVIWAVGAGRRLRAALIWAGSALVTGGFWFARNLVESGNPLPWLDRGPLPGPDQLDINIREPHTVSDYLTNGTVISDWFVPGLHHSFGFLWPLTLAILAAGIVLAILRGRTPLVRMLGVVAALSAVAYVFTPLTAAGKLNAPDAFEVNLRYVSPALGLGAMLLAIDPALSRGRAQKWLLAVLAVMLAVSVLPIDAFEDVWRGSYLPGAILLAAVLIGVPVGLTLAAQRGVSAVTVASVAALALGVSIGVGWTRSEAYLDDRYQAATAPEDKVPEGMIETLAWFNEERPSDSRIAVVGGRPGFKQYFFYGDDLSNHVQYVAHHGPQGAYVPIERCSEWIEALGAGNYDYLVAGPDQRALGTPPAEARWTRAIPGSREVLSTGEPDHVSVFELPDEFGTVSCPAPVVSAVGDTGEPLLAFRQPGSPAPQE